MNKKIIFILFIVASLVLTSCNMMGSRMQSGGMKTTNFFEGTQGLTVEFLDQAPPNTIFEGSEFDTQIYVKNKGAFSLDEPYNLKVDLTFDSAKVTSLISRDVTNLESQTTYLTGKSLDWRSGEEKYIILGRFSANAISGNFQTTSATFIAQLCYPYITNFADELCIDTDTEGMSQRDEVCEKEDRKYGGGQGAPVAITAVESQMLPRGVYVQPQFTIHIEHKGDGTISYRDLNAANYDSAQCESIQRGDINKISVEVILGGDRLNCLPNEVILKGGKAKIQCQLTQDSILGMSYNYKTSLVVKLGYLYSESWRKDIIVQKSDGNSFEEYQRGDATCHFAWEVYDQDEETCVSICKFEATHNRGFTPFNQISDAMNQYISPEYDADYLWGNIGCVYLDSTSCKDNPNLCLLQNNLCQPGSYCGLPTCVLKNKRPRFTEVMMLGQDVLQFYCSDSDDRDNLQRTCGCINEAFYGFVEKSTECNDMNSYTGVSIGTYNDKGMVHHIEGLDDDETKPLYLCLMLKDKLNQTTIRRSKYPHKY